VRDAAQQRDHGAREVVVELGGKADVGDLEMLTAETLGHASTLPGVHDDADTVVVVGGVGEPAFDRVEIDGPFGASRPGLGAVDDDGGQPGRRVAVAGSEATRVTVGGRRLVRVRWFGRVRSSRGSRCVLRVGAGVEEVVVPAFVVLEQLPRLRLSNNGS